MTWVRERGRADYRGWRLHLVTDQAVILIGLPLVDCLLFLLLWRLGWLPRIPRWGVLMSMRIMKPGEERP